MYISNEFCCICISNKNSLKVLSEAENDQISYYEKLISSVPEMCFEELNNELFTCQECLNVIKIVYDFRQKCLKSKILLKDYISQLNISTSQGISSKTNINSDSEMIDIQDKIYDLQQQTENTEEEYDYNYIDVDIKTEPGEEHEAVEYEEGDSLLDNCIKSEKASDEQNQRRVQHQDLLEVMIEDNIAHQTGDKNGSSLEDLLKRKQEEERINLVNFLKPYVCSMCRKRFTYPSQLKIHEKIHYKKKLHMCTICNKKFQDSSTYTAHMATHAAQSPYTCSICDRRFVCKLQLENHSRRHIGEEPFTCEVCSKNFRHMSSLTTHMRIHTGEKHGCDVCERRFTKKSDLNRHSRVHTGYRPHVCEICSKKFSRNDHLLKHMKTHSGQVYECNMCNKRYLQEETLAAHVTLHTGQVPFECKDCDRRFAQKKTLRRHLKICRRLEGHIILE